MAYYPAKLKVVPSALQSLANFQLPSGDIGFGRVLAPVMVQADYDKGQWSELSLQPYGPISLDPTCKVLHYAQEIFEGLKGYRMGSNVTPLLFRPEENAKRFNISAARMAMPEIPVETFLAAVEGLTAYMAPHIPNKSGDSLYIRPFMFATEVGLGIKPSEQFKFLVVASPSSSYFTQGSLSVLIERNAVRAFAGGTGLSKTGGNYAGSLKTAIEAKDLGYQQTLWLDAKQRDLIEEMSGMNFFAVVDNVLVTPPISDTILDGITRRSLIEIAPSLGIKAAERPMSMKELIEAIKQGRCTEAFACGTAAIITPIESLGERDGTRYKIGNGTWPLSTKLRQGLLDIQEGRAQGPKGWVHLVETPKK